MLALSAHGVGHGEDEAVAFDGGNPCQSDTCVTAGGCGNHVEEHILIGKDEEFKYQAVAGHSVVVNSVALEADLHKKCDHVIAVLAPMETRLSRIMARDRLSYDAAKARISAQKPDAFYEEHADFVFLNDKGLAQAEIFVDGVIAKISLLQ